jgi:hypothetical protein
MKSPRLGVTLSLSHDNGGSRPRLLNDKIDEINEINEINEILLRHQRC